MKTKLLIIIIILSICSLQSSAQVKTNLEVINDLIQQSVIQAESALEGTRSIFLSVETPQSLELIKPVVYDAFNKKGYILKSNSDSATKSIDFSIMSAIVDYTDSFSDGMFGGTLISREIKLNGSTIIKDEKNTIHPSQFVKTYSDTIKLNDIPKVENQALPFTHAQLPSLPLLSNLWEPILVVGTLTVTVILLFTVRSK